MSSGRPWAPSEKRFRGWVQTFPADPVLVPEGALVTIRNTRVINEGILFDLEQAVIIDLEIVAPGAVPQHVTVELEPPRDPDLRGLENLLAHFQTSLQTEDLLGHSVARFRLLQTDPEASERMRSLLAPVSPEQPDLRNAFDVLHSVLFFQQALDRLTGDLTTIPIEEGDREEARAAYRGALGAAYRLGRKVQLAELKAAGYEERALTPQRKAKVAAVAGGLLATAKAEKWQTPCLPWVQSLIDAHSSPPTKGQIADDIILNWPNRGFPGGPRTSKANMQPDRDSPPPSRDSLFIKYLPKWKKQGLRGMR
jgi:hypothetical protein